MGSGHILAYLFDVLMQIYRSAGYTDRDAAASIVEHNLYGLDTVSYTHLDVYKRQTTHPDLAAEWSDRNHPLLPDEVNEKSRRNVWWKCKTCGNEWKSVINARVKGTVCPVCADRAVLAGYNDLATTDRKLLAEWDLRLLQR